MLINLVVYKWQNRHNIKLYLKVARQLFSYYLLRKPFTSHILNSTFSMKQILVCWFNNIDWITCLFVDNIATELLILFLLYLYTTWHCKSAVLDSVLLNMFNKNFWRKNFQFSPRLFFVSGLCHLKGMQCFNIWIVFICIYLLIIWERVCLSHCAGMEAWGELLRAGAFFPSPCGSRIAFWTPAITSGSATIWDRLGAQHFCDFPFLFTNAHLFIYAILLCSSMKLRSSHHLNPACILNFVCALLLWMLLLMKMFTFSH